MFLGVKVWGYLDLARHVGNRYDAVGRGALRL